MADEQAFRSMLESGWKNIGRKGSRARLSMKSLEEVEPTKPAPIVTIASTPSKGIGASSSTSTGMLGSWAKLLSKNSMDEPTVQDTSETAMPDIVANVDVNEAVVDDLDTAEATDPDHAEEAAELDADDPIPETTDDALVETDNLDQVDEVLVEGMDEEGDVEGQEVTEDDIVGEEEIVDTHDIAAEDMDEEEAPASKSPEAATKPASAETPNVPKAGDKPAAEDDDDCIMIDAEDDNMAGAEFRLALDELPSSKVTKTQAKVAIRPKPLGMTPPKPPGTAPPNAFGSQGPKAPGPQVNKAPGAQGNKNGQAVPPVRTLSGNLRQATPINVGSNANTPKAKGGIIRTISGSQGNQTKAGSIIPQGNQAKAGSISPQGNQAKAGKITPLNKSTSTPMLETSISGGKIIRTNSGNVQAPLIRTNSGNFGKGGTIKPTISPSGGEIKRINSGTIIPTVGDLKRTNSGGVISPQGARNKQADNTAAKRARTDTGPIAAVDAEGRRYNLNVVVVNFANVGASYAKKVLKRDGENQPSTLFDWEGVRRCTQYLGKNLGLKVIGVIYENFWATDNDSKNKVELPKDIKKLCESIEETPRIVGKNHGSADDEMTIKCAYHRNCRFMDNDNYRDWKQQLRDEKCRNWLDKCQDLLHMRYYFDSSMGVFETLDGNVPPGLLAPDGVKIPVSVSKRDLWTASNK